MTITDHRDAKTDLIPILDLQPLIDGSPEAVSQLARELRAALTDVGFFFVVNHGVDWGQVQAVYNEAKRLHAGPVDELATIKMDGDHGGYLGLGGGTSYASEIAGEIRTPNLNAAYFVHRGGYRLGNRWPDLEGFRQTIDDYMDAVTQLCRRLLPVLATSLDLPEDTFEPHFGRSVCTLRMSHYPVLDYGEHDWGLAPHTDSSIVTLLPANDVPGLEIRPAGHDWIVPPALPESFLINSGDMLKRWTNNRFRSTAHRARNNSSTDRYAIPFFFGARDDAVIEALPTCVDQDHPAKHEPITLRRLSALVPESELRQRDRHQGHRGSTVTQPQPAPHSTEAEAKTETETEAKTICVFCGSSSGSDPAFATMAERLGVELAEAGHRLVYGGGDVGLMGIVANAVMEAGADVIGVMTEQLVEAEVAHTGLTVLDVQPTMHGRKARMAELADGVVVLPAVSAPWRKRSKSSPGTSWASSPHP